MKTAGRCNGVVCMFPPWLANEPVDSITPVAQELIMAVASVQITMTN
jgi:hypothetical protein